MVKDSLASAEDVGSIPGLEMLWNRKWQPSPVLWPGKFHNRGDWQATIHGVAKESETTEQLNNNKVLTLCYEEYQCRFIFCRQVASLETHSIN